MSKTEWDLFLSTFSGLGIPEVDPNEFAKSPAVVRSFCHRLGRSACRDVFHAYRMMMKDDVPIDQIVDSLSRFVSSGHENGAPWANEDSILTIHREYLDSIDWESPHRGGSDPPF